MEIKKRQQLLLYLIKYGRVDADTAVKMLRTKNKTSFYPNIDFYNSLKMMENDI